MVYYNEFDPRAAEWLRNLIEAGLLPKGDVDERSITEVTAEDVRYYNQCHFFAGIGGWSLALRLADWPEDRPVWTGSCPCQPFSSAGKGLATDDPRHLWPHFRRLISECEPSVVFGEQVASKAGRSWMCGVRTDLEALGYGVGAADLCAASIGAPHIRQRLWWVADRWFGGRVADSECSGLEGCNGSGHCSQGHGQGKTGPVVPSSRNCCRVGNPSSVGPCRGETDSAGQQPEVSGSGPERGGVADSQRDGGWPNESGRRPEERVVAGRRGEGCGVADATDTDRRSGERQAEAGAGPDPERGRRPAICGPWNDALWWPCSDGKIRRVPASIGPDGEAAIEPGIFPLASRVSGRVAVARTGKSCGSEVPASETIKYVSATAALKGAGNAIVPQLAAEFILAYQEAAECISK